MNKTLSKTVFPEKWIFLVLVIINALPVFLYKFFPSMDGAVHTYNAQNIIELLRNSDSRLHDYMIFNPEPVPNWGGHVLISLFSMVFPAYIAEKLMFLTYFIGLPYAFRYFIIKGTQQKPAFSYLIFPLTYTFLLGLGFYNFSLALVLMFVILGFWGKNKLSLSVKNFVLLFLLIHALYFTHMFVYSVVGLVLIISIIYDFILYAKTHQFQNHVFKTLNLIGAFSISIYLMIKQLFFSGEFTLKGESKFLSTEELINGILHVRGSIIYSKSDEGAVLVFFFIILVIITSYILVQRLRKKQLSNHKGVDAYLFAAIVLLLLYFLIPNNLPGKGGHMSFRFITAFYLVWIAWVAAHKISRHLTLPAIILTLIISSILITQRSGRINNLSKAAEEIYAMSDHLKPESTVLPFNYSKNWLHPHYSAYLGYKKPVIIMENYELSKKVFPLVWNPDMPKVLFGDKDFTQTCTYWISNNKNKHKIEPADYIFFWGKKTDNCRKELEELTQKHYQLVAKSKHGTLHKRKQ